MLLARIVPGLSFALQNPLLALLGIPFRIYFAYSMLAQGLLAMLMCAIGAAQRQSTTQTVTLAAVAIIGICALAHFGIYRGWRRGAVQENALVNKT